MKQSITIATLLITILVLIGQGYTAECRKTQWCMACSETVENKCDACFNWGSGTHLPRALNTAVTPQDCVTPLSFTIANCKWYSGLDTTTASARTIETCHVCEKKFLKWNSVSNTSHCSDELPFGQKEIENCGTQVFFETSTTITTGCRMCKKGFSGSGWDTINNAGSKSCPKNLAITNCMKVTGQSDGSYQCYHCKANYAVNITMTGCVSFTLDPNCRTLLGGTKGCHYCWHSYYWDNILCILAGEVIRFGFLGLIGVLAVNFM
jgi:hypothetical protein